MKKNVLNQIDEALEALQKKKFWDGFFWGFVTACTLVTLVCVITWP